MCEFISVARGIASEYQQYSGYLLSATNLASRTSVSAPLFPQVVVEPVTNSVADCQPGQQPNLGVLRVDIDSLYELIPIPTVLTMRTILHSRLYELCSMGVDCTVHLQQRNGEAR